MTESQINELIVNRNNIPDEFWRDTENGMYKVIWIVSRNKPSTAADQSYSYDEERLGITKDGYIIFGWDSGCSCPSPWVDCGDKVYQKKTWKEFKLDPGEASNIEWDKEAVDNLKDLHLLVKKKVTPEEVFTARNAEVRRFLMKSVGFENIKKRMKITIVHRDDKGQELFYLSDTPLKRMVGTVDKEEGQKLRQIEWYVKVNDASTEREYILSVPGLDWIPVQQLYGPSVRSVHEDIAWTFDLKPEDYKPDIET